MKKFGGILFIIIVGAVGTAFFANSSNIAKALSTTYTCQPSGTFSSLPQDTLSANDIQRSIQAMQWLKAQENTTTAVGDGEITTDQPYAKEYTGPVSGTFSIGSASNAVISDASIEITSHSSLPANFTGVVQGKILIQPTAWRWIIQVYKEVNGTYTQVPQQALADASTGEFTLDLSTVPNPPEGNWAFGILDAEASYAPYGEKWPSVEYYQNLEVQLKLVTDGIYDWATTRALASNSYSFDGSNTGLKMVRLVNNSTNEVLAEYVPLSGLVRSYEIDPGHPQYGSAFGRETFVYDQAMAIFAALSANDDAFAKRLVDGMLRMQESSGAREGGFVFASPQLGPEYRDALIRTGAHAIATDALIAFLEKYPQISNYATYKQHAVAALNFIDNTQSISGTTQGLYLGGYGDYSGPGNSFVANSTITWASTEHNIDIWHTFIRASNVIDSKYKLKADSLQQAMTSKLFNTSEARYNQGMTTSGPDTADPLDVNSWGAIQLYATNQKAQAQTSIQGLNPFVVTQAGVTGYAPFYDSPGYPGATPTVWYEGSYGVLMALARTGAIGQYKTLLISLRQGQENDGSFRYATSVDPIYEISNHKSVASTAWFVLATTGLETMWNRCNYTAPETDTEGGLPTVPANEGQSTPRGEEIAQSNPISNGAIGTTPSPITEDATIIKNPDSEDGNSGKSAGTNNTDTNEQEKSPTKQSMMPWFIWGGSGIAGVVIISLIILAVRKRIS